MPTCDTLMEAIKPLARPSLDNSELGACPMDRNHSSTMWLTDTMFSPENHDFDMVNVEFDSVFACTSSFPESKEIEASFAPCDAHGREQQFFVLEKPQSPYSGDSNEEDVDPVYLAAAMRQKKARDELRQIRLVHNAKIGLQLHIAVSKRMQAKKFSLQ